MDTEAVGKKRRTTDDQKQNYDHNIRWIYNYRTPAPLSATNCNTREISRRNEVLVFFHGRFPYMGPKI